MTLGCDPPKIFPNKVECLTCNPHSYEDLLARLGTVIEPETFHVRGSLGSRTQKIFAVRPGISGNLDVARQTYSETVDDFQNSVDAVVSLGD